MMAGKPDPPSASFGRTAPSDAIHAALYGLGNCAAAVPVAGVASLLAMSMSASVPQCLDTPAGSTSNGKEFVSDHAAWSVVCHSSAGSALSRKAYTSSVLGVSSAPIHEVVPVPQSVGSRVALAAPPSVEYARCAVAVASHLPNV